MNRRRFTQIPLPFDGPSPPKPQEPEAPDPKPILAPPRKVPCLPIEIEEAKASLLAAADALKTAGSKSDEARIQARVELESAWQVYLYLSLEYAGKCREQAVDAGTLQVIAAPSLPVDRRYSPTFLYEETPSKTTCPRDPKVWNRALPEKARNW